MNKPSNKGKGTNGTRTSEPIKVTSYDVSRVHLVGKNDSVAFDLTINGVKIFGCFVVEGKQGDFISMPSRKGSDGNYYAYVYAPLSDKDQADILAEVERQLNSEE